MQSGDVSGVCDSNRHDDIGYTFPTGFSLAAIPTGHCEDVSILLPFLSCTAVKLFSKSVNW